MSSATRSRLRGRVLIVEDDEGVRSGLRRLLSEMDFDVVGEADNGSDGVEKTAVLDPDVVLMDLSMPVMGGLEAARLIRHRMPAVQIVILTVYDDPALKEDAASLGIYAFLVKGCSARLIETVAETATAVRRSMDGTG
ncbi:MAG: response regulator transcription factor [Actinomycetota bacterium]